MELKGKKVLVVDWASPAWLRALVLRQHALRLRSPICAPPQPSPGDSRAPRTRHHGRVRRTWAADLPSPGPDRRQPRRPTRYARTGAVKTFGLPVIGELELAASIQGQILAITGSNGKTTTMR